MSTFHERKKGRSDYYHKHVKGWKLRPCSACAGSGYYDSDGSPDCGACDGTGKERYNPIEEEKSMIHLMKINIERWQMRFWNGYIETSRGKQFLETKEGKELSEKVENFMR